MSKRLITAALATAAILFAASAEAKKGGHHMMMVEMMKKQDVTIDGKTATVFVVKMNGHMMVAIPEENIPDALHQQLFTVSH